MRGLGVIVILTFSFLVACNRQISQHGSIVTGSATGLADPVDTLEVIYSSDPDGIPGNASTYGTGTGVSGQTPAGKGNGTGNTGKSGFGVKKEIDLD